MILPTSGMLIAGANNGQLRLEEPLGAGAFGVVFKARHVTDGTLYAVKFPQYAVFGGEPDRTAFLNEVRASQEIQHPNVVRVVHVEVDSPEYPPYLVLEFIPGGTLKTRLDLLRASRSLVDLDSIQMWTNDLIEGIAAINTKMLHRDLKPDNILLDDDTPKIGDFGLSKVIGMLTRSRTFKGGQHMWYMAPEGWKFETNTIQLDMYAMGIVFYEIASLQFPYQLPQDPSDVEALRKMHLYQSARPLQQLRSELPLGFCHVIARLIEKNPQERFQDWLEIRRALDKAWETYMEDEASPRGVVQSLLYEAEQHHEVYTRQQLEEKQRQEEQEERRQLDAVQQRRLVESIKAQIAEFNEHCAFKERIIEIPTNEGFGWQLPFSGTISLRFFSIDPPLTLKEGQVRYAAVLQDADKAGLNYLLCRNGADDLYGVWKICWVKHGALVDPRKLRPRPQPFGFDNAKDMQEIELAERAMHIYTVEFSEEIQDTFLHVALEAMRRGKTR
jgi:serine/threonine protein kinase